MPLTGKKVSPRKFNVEVILRTPISIRLLLQLHRVTRSLTFFLLFFSLPPSLSFSCSSLTFIFFVFFLWLGVGCQAAGFITVLASELSIYSLTVITLERWYAITYAIHLNRRLKLGLAIKVMIGGWIYSIFMALLPNLGVSGYSRTSICLPMEHGTILDVTYLTVLLTVNAIAFTIICLCYGKVRDSFINSSSFRFFPFSIPFFLSYLSFLFFSSWFLFFPFLMNSVPFTFFFHITSPFFPTLYLSSSILHLPSFLLCIFLSFGKFFFLLTNIKVGSWDHVGYWVNEMNLSFSPWSNPLDVSFDRWSTNKGDVEWLDCCQKNGFTCLYRLRLLGANRLFWIDGCCWSSIDLCHKFQIFTRILLPTQFMCQSLLVCHSHEAVSKGFFHPYLQVWLLFGESS